MPRLHLRHNRVRELAFSFSMAVLETDPALRASSVTVGAVDHPQRGCSDFYRGLGDLFGVPLERHNRWGGFKELRQKRGTASPARSRARCSSSTRRRRC